MASGTKVQLRLGERVVAEVSFEGAAMRIGRMKENDLVINNLAVSRFHAVLRRVGDAFEIEDLGSENGTLVDGVAVSGSALIPDGASITIGKHSLSLRAGGDGQSRPPLPRKSDVWDAAQTYFAPGVIPAADGEAVAAEEEEAEAVAEEGAGSVGVGVEELAVAVGVEEEAVAVHVEEEAVAVGAEEEPGAMGVEEDPLALDVLEVAVEPESEGSHACVDAIDEPALSPAEAVALRSEAVAAPWLPEETGSEAQPLEMPAPDGAPLSVPDPDEILGFGEEELVGAAMPDPVAAEAPNAVVEAEEIPRSLAESALDEASVEPSAIEAAGQTSLFDFGLTDDLGLSDRSMARVARGEPSADASKSAAVPETSDVLHAGLIVERGGHVERVMAWDAPKLLIGRAPESGLVLAGSGVSRRHAELRIDAGAREVRDLGSANGVYVNGALVERVVLEQGDVIRVDDYTLTFVLDREPVAESVQGSARNLEGSPREAVPVELSEVPMPERDLVLAEDAELEAAPADKQLEASASGAASASETGDPLVWALEVAIATERLPEAMRRALEAMDAAELVLPAQLRLVRRN